MTKSHDEFFTEAESTEYRRISEPDKFVAALVEIARKKEVSVKTLRTPNGNIQ